ncbi:MarR family winged helix-turn-helix transcriptional regulator [Wukongibacter sp. M2B1]|uniref:MarR family winged helix-turn-helix transcriptional regulator n=1 Tax=Wukongibacter sp. M2B1 TaxID=3088895 RepID=UPI003D79BD24
MANYYKQINLMIEKIINKILIADKKGFSIGRKNEELSLLDIFVIKKIGSNNMKPIYSLVKETEIDRGVISSIINKLAANGYIKKEKAKEDKRVNMVILTDEGEEVYNKILRGQSEILDFILNDITLNEEKAILKFLSKVNQKIMY